MLGEDEAHGGILDHREYVVYKPEQILPRYLLWYRHGEQCQCFRCAGGAEKSRAQGPWRFSGREASLLTRGAQVQRNEVGMRGLRGLGLHLKRPHSLWDSDLTHALLRRKVLDTEDIDVVVRL